MITKQCSTSYEKSCKTETKTKYKTEYEQECETITVQNCYKESSSKETQEMRERENLTSYLTCYTGCEAH